MSSASRWRAARQILEDQGFKVVVVREANTRAPGEVFAQNPQEGELEADRHDGAAVGVLGR